MVVDGDGKLLLGLVLADDVIVKEGLHFLGLGQMAGDGSGSGFAAVIFKDGVADSYTFVADVSAGVVAGRRDKFSHRVL